MSEKLKLFFIFFLFHKMPTIIKGNILESKESYIAHGCNCVGAFGAGLAGQIAHTFPEVREAYRKKHAEEGWKLGEIQIVKTEGGPTIINCATQYTYRGYGLLADYGAIRTCLQKIKSMLPNEAVIALPKIGCGLARGEWSVVEKIIEEELGDRAKVYVLE